MELLSKSLDNSLRGTGIAGIYYNNDNAPVSVYSQFFFALHIIPGGYISIL